MFALQTEETNNGTGDGGERVTGPGSVGQGVGLQRVPFKLPADRA
ncbi:hypothetical protein [Rubrivirga sp. SAORIC476]|nr:hypothetical protein [Rubrivirga sp. SAORIC476]